MIIQNPAGDPLSAVLALSELRADCSVRLQAGGVWALRFQPIELKFNVVRRGECWLRMQGMPARLLQAGDCFVVSRTPFILASGPDIEAVNAADVFALDGASATFGVGEEVELLGGSVSLSGPGATELLDVLPTSLIIRAETAGASSFGWLLDELGREWPSHQPGSQAMCNDLLRLIFIHALRHHINSADAEQLAWLGGLREPAIAGVLRAIHAAPQKPWRLTQMAEMACMSRSGFAALFKTCMGVAPVEYATRWRMRVAAFRLRNGRENVATVAASLGYLSDAAFGAAFRRVHGISPGQYRRDLLL
ncbi:AraC family transcriptional regulator [Pseudomonas viridiflava]|uniref:AraC family transcriptional regulator n=1 Tax=Pseudomonas sp. H26/SER47-MNA-CIBAN-0231 TaxID=3140477 RepID=UPI001F154462